MSGIGVAAFEQYTNLLSIIIPNSVTNIGRRAFYACHSLKNVTIPDSVTSLEDQAFSCCITLTNVTIGAGVTNIGGGAFYSCSLERLTIPDNVKKMGSFGYCTNLRYVVIGNGITHITGSAFERCYNLQRVSIGKNVTSIGESAFRNTHLSSVEIPDGVTNIENEVFMTDSFNFYGNVLSSVLIPKSVTSIGSNAFATTPLATVYVSRGDTQRIKNLLAASGYDASGVAFVERDTRYSVQFHPNGGTGSMAIQEAVPGSSVSLLPNAFTRDGYIFVGWALSANGSVAYLDKAQVSNLAKVGETVTLFAVWTVGQIVFFEGNGGKCKTTLKTYAFGNTYGELPDATRAGYSFAGWWTAQNGGTQVTTGSRVTTDSTRTLYAHWTAGSQTVTFKGNGGTPETQTGTYTVDGKYGSFPSVARAGYTFAGWWTKQSGGTQVTTDSTVTTGATRTLYAHWTAGTQTVTFMGNGGTPETQTGTYTVDGKYESFPSVTREEWSFAGWWTEQSGGTQVTTDTTVTTDPARTLYAHWTLTVTFNGNGGTPETQTGTYTVDKKYGSFPAVTREGGAFAGWWTEADGGTQVTTKSIVSTDSARMLYAHWLLLVSFQGNGGKPETQTGMYSIGETYGSDCFLICIYFIFNLQHLDI